MPKFLFEASYTFEGVKGVQREGGNSRRDAVARAIGSVGGRLESFYFAFGDRDAYVIADLPDNESATAVALTVNASGAATVRTVVLLTPEEVDAAAERSVGYRPPIGEPLHLPGAAATRR
ncbi:MAG: GYD domain-containing protein [Actinomycetota bacterium]|nr:GYD domain-containing protein [Actinomycetota bacterium]